MVYSRDEWKLSNTNGFFGDYANFTISQLLTQGERSLSHISQISFDPTYGFISNCRFGHPNDWGLLSPKISHCCSRFEISNSQVLEH
jgi:hypothetical protein